MTKTVAREVTITYLEQTARPSLPPQPRPRASLAILRAVDPPVHFYRYLYDTVGRDWHWRTRKMMTDEALAEVIGDPAVHIYVLYAAGVPAGFGEIDAREAGVVDIRFFGLVRDYIGRGFSRFFLSEIIGLAWTHAPSRVRIETCTLDHPAALPLYQKLGFNVYDQRAGVIDIDVNENDKKGATE